MKRQTVYIYIVIFVVQTLTYGQQALDLKNDNYKLTVLPDQRIAVSSVSGKLNTTYFSPKFKVIYSDKNPKLKTQYVGSIAYRLPTWSKYGDSESETFNVTEAGQEISASAKSSKLSQNGDQIHFKFPSSKYFSFNVILTLPEGSGEPKLSYELIPKKPGWFSVGYTGATALAEKQIDAIWQPTIWQERRFPEKPYLSMEYLSTFPTTLMSYKGKTIGVIADPASIPFRMPNLKNSKFGLRIKTDEGNIQPQIFSPILGGSESKMEPKEVYHFGIRLVSSKLDLQEAYRELVTGLYKFKDYRKNGTATLNETIDNMLQFGMNEYYSNWNSDLKGFDYREDVAGTVKNVSALHPLSVSIVTDNEEIYHDRALPIMEYLMSRQKYLFSFTGKKDRQFSSFNMDGPAMEVSELSALFNISKKRSPVFLNYADSLNGVSRILNLKKVSEKDNWKNLLSLYRATGEKSYLERAETKAKKYIDLRINTMQEDFTDARIENGSHFMTDYAPEWVDLLELYEETGNKEYLYGAKRGADLHCMYTWFFPVVPEGTVLINKNDQVAKVHRQYKKTFLAGEQEVPAWRVSQIGLTPESPRTFNQNPALFLAHHAAYLARLAQYTGDSFYYDLAKSAIIGRYTNYPGYDINEEFTTYTQRHDYPYHDYDKNFTYNQMYYNHVWPHIALLIDYAVSDVFYRSNGEIDFPSEYAQGYAYLQSKVYGHKEGRVYNDENVRLWMPQKLLRTDDIQINYISGYSNENLYLSFTNQTSDKKQFSVQLNPDIVPFNANLDYEVEIMGVEKTNEIVMRDGKLSLNIDGNGIVTVKIKKIKIIPTFQHQIYDQTSLLSNNSYHKVENDLGEMTAMLVSMGKDLLNGYIWLKAKDSELQSVKLWYRHDQNQKWTEMKDNTYPFEFSFSLPDNLGTMEWKIEGTNLEGKVISSKIETLIAQKK